MRILEVHQDIYRASFRGVPHSAILQTKLLRKPPVPAPALHEFAPVLCPLAELQCSSDSWTSRAINDVLLHVLCEADQTLRRLGIPIFEAVAGPQLVAVLAALGIDAELRDLRSHSVAVHSASLKLLRYKK